MDESAYTGLDKEPPLKKDDQTRFCGDAGGRRRPFRTRTSSFFKNTDMLFSPRWSQADLRQMRGATQKRQHSFNQGFIGRIHV